MKQLVLGVIVLMFALSGRVSIVYIYCLLSIFIVYFQCHFLLSISNVDFYRLSNV